MFHVPYHRENAKAFSDASALQKNISHLSGQIKDSIKMIKSEEDLTNGTVSPSVKKDRFANFKKSHISHSTGDLNVNRINLSLFGDVQLNDSQFFEVMYVGKIRVSHRKLPKTFIDDAIPKFIAHDKMKMKSLEINSVSNENGVDHDENRDDGSDTSSNNNDDVFLPTNNHKAALQRCNSTQIETPKRTRSASIGSIEQNRTMVYILGRSDLRLISPDRKQILLHKNFVDVVNVVQGTENSDHFGIICNEVKESKQEFIGYVFKCQSGSIATDVVNSMTKSLETLEKDRIDAEEEAEKNKSPVQLTCDHCPMIWYNKLCSTIEGFTDKKAYNVIMKTMEDLSSHDYDILMEKYFASDKVDDYPFSEKNKFLMALIEAHCQLRQQRHVHDTIENRSEFLNQYLGGSTIFMKAKRSITSSFDQLLKRRGSRDVNDGNSQIDVHEEEPSRRPTRGILSRSVSLSPNAPQTLTFKADGSEKQQTNTSKMDMFLKVGNTTKESEKKTGTWRQNIFKTISNETDSKHIDDPMKLLAQPKKKQLVRVKRSKQELRDLWKSAGKQIILLIRMEKENARLQVKQNENEIRRMKLDYDEIVTCDGRLTETWEKIILQASKAEIDNRLYLPTLKSGVPQSIRGDVWLMLARQYNKTHPQFDASEFPNYNVPYNELLKNLTEHQHAIFMDIGRTFPRHEYYRSPFGLGQLSLFNILKAYSILDPDVGYCQGLAFICGILLLHLNEEDTYWLLKHLMFDRQFRLNYLPDMKHFQLQLYQMSRLIKDNLPELYELLDKNEVAITLYASSWMLTLFSSSFELGFVTRVYDLLLYASNEVIFRVIISLLDVHKEEILKLDSFEDIMDYMKNVIPKIDAATMSKVLKNVYELNITRQLLDYKIEYNVLKDEIVNTAQHTENLRSAKDEIKSLQKQLEIVEGIRLDQQQQDQMMKLQIQSLEATIQTMGDFLTSLSINRTDVEIPSDVRRLLQQLEYQQNKQTQQLKRRPIFLDRKINKSMSVNHNLGMSLKVLIEQNENDNQTPPCAVTPTPELTPRKKYFEKTFEQIKQNNGRRLLSRDSPEKPKLIEQASIDETVFEEELQVSPSPDTQSHPLCCEDVNFQFNAIKLKSINTTNAFKKTLE